MKMETIDWHRYTPAELRQAAEILIQLAENKERESELIRSLQTNVAEQRNGEMKNAETQAAPKDGKGESNGHARKPMRPPRAGSIRADVYRVLSKTPAERQEIIARVAKLRKIAVDEKLIANVGAVLGDKFDPQIVHTCYGMYALAPGREKG